MKTSDLEVCRKMLQLRVQRSKLTYEAAQSPPFGTLIDTAGRRVIGLRYFAAAARPTRALRTGAGMVSPGLSAAHKIRFSSSGSARS